MLVQLRRRAAGQHPAAMHDQQVIKTPGFIHISGGDNDAETGFLRADPLDQLPELTARQWVYACGRFIQDQQLRVVNERAAQTEFLFHAAGQLTSRPRQKGRQAGGGGQFVDTPAPL